MKKERGGKKESEGRIRGNERRKQIGKKNVKKQERGMRVEERKRGRNKNEGKINHKRGKNQK